MLKILRLKQKKWFSVKKKKVFNLILSKLLYLVTYYILDGVIHFLLANVLFIFKDSSFIDLPSIFKFEICSNILLPKHLQTYYQKYITLHFFQSIIK